MSAADTASAGSGQGSGERIAGIRARSGGWVGPLRDHLAFVLLLIIAAAVRGLTMVAYSPALMFSDSWGYLESAYTGNPISLSYLRPNGYPLILRVLTLPHRNLDQIVAVQHAAGLIIGALVYTALLRVRAPRLLALAAAALVLLDGYVITLEQYVMPDTLFSLSVVGAALLVAWPGLNLAAQWAGRGAVAISLSVRRAALAGLVLAAAILQREVALFTIPAFLVYLLWRRVSPRSMLAFLLALALPVLAYAAVYQSSTGVFGLSASDGWTLYGRVGGFASCAGTKIPPADHALCETPAEQASHPDAPTWYIWSLDSPALRLFPSAHDSLQEQERGNRALSGFARQIIEHQPLDYLDATFSDVLRYFTPGAAPYADASSATSLPVRASREARDSWVRRRTIPNLSPQVRSPAGVLRAYRRLLHVPRPWLALLALASLLVLLMPVARRPHPARSPEVLLLSGGALLMLVGTAATAGFGLRYLLPAVPLLGLGGSLALIELSRLVPRGLLILRRPTSR